MNMALTSSDPRFLPLMTTLTGDGEGAPDLPSLVQGYADKLLSLGLPLDRASVHIGTLHSEHIGSGFVWRRGQEVQETHYGFSTRQDRMYLESPIRMVKESGQPLEIWPLAEGAEHYSILPELRADGLAHYLAYPLFFSDGEINCATFATKSPDGFDTRDRALLESLLPLYSRMLEIKSLRRTIEEILQIYVGRGPGTQILNGNVKRGQVSRLSAAMLLADLRHFSELSTRLPERKLVGVLNRFFDCFVPPIVEEGGEVLKFIGDAVLAIFPQPDGMAPVSSPRERAYQAALQGLANLNTLNGGLTEEPAILEASVALHLGRVAYGNVGSVERLDFTVIGPDVNLVSRLADLASTLDQPLLLSERFATGMNQPLRDLGPHRLKGFVQRERVFAPENPLALSLAEA